MKTHLVLLRGVNVGGNRKLPMADLRAFVEGLGFQEVSTLLQSGNLVFESNGQRDDATLATFLETEAHRQLGLHTTFLVRTVAEWRGIIARNPYPEAAVTAPNHLLVRFSRTPPAAGAAEAWAKLAVGDERFQVDDRHLYAVLPHGVGDSKLATMLMNPRFGPDATCRNWNTVTKLGTLAGL